MSPPSDTSDLTQNHYGAPFTTQDVGFGILGEKNGCKVFDTLLTFFSFLGG